MNLRPVSIVFCLGLLAMSLANSRPAHATLGEKADSVAKDRKALSAVKKSTTTGSKYTVQEVGSTATTVREYISPSGIVFAVAWNGLVHPDLSVLLGTYSGDYQSAKRQMKRTPSRKRSQVQGSQVVVETWGHMRNLQGRAYVPALVPSGVNINEIH